MSFYGRLFMLFQQQSKQSETMRSRDAAICEQSSSQKERLHQLGTCHLKDAHHFPRSSFRRHWTCLATAHSKTVQTSNAAAFYTRMTTNKMQSIQGFHQLHLTQNVAIYTNARNAEETIIIMLLQMLFCFYLCHKCLVYVEMNTFLWKMLANLYKHYL